MSKHTDPAIEALLERLDASDAATAKNLWVADEHPLPPSFFQTLANKGALFLSNRFDHYQLASKQGVGSMFSDIDLSDFETKAIERIFFRVAKERALVHRLINQAKHVLPCGASLWLCGYKKEGIKTHIQRAEECFGTKAKVTRLKNQLLVAELVLDDSDNPELSDENYALLREITCEKFKFWSKPGLYGWNKIDKASEYLMDWLDKNTGRLSGQRVLDLGCGYGYLSIRAHELGADEIVATDNSAAALAACKKNLEAFEIPVTVAPSGAGADLSGKFNSILCNPPFHQGFSTTSNLHEQFIKQTKQLLFDNGTAWYVVNQFLEIDNIAKVVELEAEETHRTKSFKIVRLTHR